MTSIEGQPNSTNRVSRISYRITTKLGRSHEINGISTKSHEEAI